MDKDLRNLLVEVARGILRALDTPTDRVQPLPAKVIAAPDAVVPSFVKTVAPGIAERGSTVRVWTGDRYEVGKVKAICRGEPRRVWVEIARAGKRNKKVRVEQAKCEVLS